MDYHTDQLVIGVEVKKSTKTIQCGLQNWHYVSHVRHLPHTDPCLNSSEDWAIVAQLVSAKEALQMTTEGDKTLASSLMQIANAAEHLLEEFEHPQIQMIVNGV